MQSLSTTSTVSKRTILSKWLPALIILIILTLSAVPALFKANGQNNLHVTQAGAWLQGRTDVPPGIDVSLIGGKNYVGFPPFPSLLVLPYVAVAGVQATNTVLVSLLLSALNIALLLLICRAWQIDVSTSLWTTAGFILGSAYFQTLFLSNGVWYFAHIVAVTCSLLAIFFAKRTGLGLLSGLFVGFAFLSRQFTIFIAVFVLVVLWQHSRSAERKSRWVQLALFAGALAMCMAVYLGYNALRFGNPFDTGYASMPMDGFRQGRFSTYGLFDIHYVPFNLYYLLFAGYQLNFAPPYYLDPLEPSWFGTSLLIASPFILSSLVARGNRLFLIAAWTSIALIAVPQLFYYNNGWAQFNAQRFTLDFWPVLFVLVALGGQSALRLPDPQSSFRGLRNEDLGRLWRAAILYAIGLNAFTWFFLPRFV